MDEMKKKKKKKKQGGRPRVEIDWKVFDNLCHIWCTLREIASAFSCSEDTIERAVKREKGVGFAEYYKEKADGGRIALRRKQLQVALAGNVTMMIFLGKQKLSQIDEKIVRGDVTLHKELLKLIEDQDEK